MQTPVETNIQRLSYRFTDFEEQQAAMTDWDQVYQRLAPGDFEGGVDLMSAGARTLFRERWSRQFRYQGTGPIGTCAFAIPVRQAKPATWVGQHVGKNTVIFQAPGQEADLLSSDEQDLFVLTVPTDEVQETCMAFSKQDRFSDASAGVVDLKPEVAARLRAMAHDLLSTDPTSTGPEGDWAVEKAFRQFSKAFLYELTVSKETNADNPKLSRASRIVRNATDLMQADMASQYGLVDICSELGISLRALHYAFADATGMTPANWLRRIRLNRVHTDLKTSSPSDGRVKTIAARHGFVHLGHFAAQYRTLFGCTPSETLNAV
ncbi:helix-turn-helix domain-containing protein [Seohaeicola saemankumensis]|nr:helix-turn-helix domain-containing protein [Seohaeicola saemankumensis]MCA0869983.1 helix-turn-helix domain-containing protein [Seohaeicola saemankumensis]